MSRTSKGPRHYAESNAYFATIKGTRKRLLVGAKTRKNDAVAAERYKEFAAEQGLVDNGSKSPISTILNAYCNTAMTRTMPEAIVPNTHRIHRKACNSFANFVYSPGKTLGQMPYFKLRIDHVNAWIAAGKAGEFGHKPWSDSYANLQLRSLRVVLRWAVLEGDLVKTTPFSKHGNRIRLGSPPRSFQGLATTDAEHAVLLAQARRRKTSSFALLLDLLYHTGARPAEIYKMRAEEYDPVARTIVIDPSSSHAVGRLKKRRWLVKKGRKRVIRLPPEMIPPLEELLSQRPAAAPVFVTEKGTPWKDSQTISQRFGSLLDTVNKKAGAEVVRPGVILYSYRHAFVTRWLVSGGDALVLCELLNTSLQMLQEHYSHLFEDTARLDAAVLAFATQQQESRQSRPPTPPPA